MRIIIKNKDLRNRLKKIFFHSDEDFSNPNPEQFRVCIMFSHTYIFLQVLNTYCFFITYNQEQE